MQQLLPKDISDSLQKRFSGKTMVMLVGLPASGKSTICKQLADVLAENNYKGRIYNAGNVRRMVKQEFSHADFFDPANENAKEQREQFATMSLEQMFEDFRHNKISVGFLDATNTTKARRRRMLDLVHSCNIDFANIVVLDVTCTDDRLLAFNIANKAFNADYCGRNVADSIADFRQRTTHYFKVYEPVELLEFTQYGDVQIVRIGNGGRQYCVPDTPCDDVARLIRDFACNYFFTYGEKYLSEAEKFDGGI